MSSSSDQPADFEKAISATGFGLFNIFLLLVAIPSCAATVYETSTMSYILPAAECDLKLSLMDKGMLNAITYAGMITSAIMWGFLADTLGRKKLLVYGLFLDGICVICGGLSQNVYTLMVFKFLGGFLVCGPFAVLVSYMTEFHGTRHRSVVMMAIGMFFSIATITLPILAWFVLPKNWNFTLIKKSLEIHSWQIFIGISALPSLLSSFCIIFLPESPKFLMSKGRNEEALDVFRLMFALNTRKNKSEYPVKVLVEEVQPVEAEKVYTIDFVGSMADLTAHKNTHEPVTHAHTRQSVSHAHARQSISASGAQWKPMFGKPYLRQAIHVFTIQFCILLGLNTFRLWLPQLFASIAKFEESVTSATSKDASNLCSMLEYNAKITEVYLHKNATLTCDIKISDKMYVNTMVVGIAQFGGYLVAGALINALGNKWILIIGLTISGSCGTALYWAKNSQTTLILSSFYVSVGSVGSTSLVGVVVNLFPTSMRTMIVSLVMMFGRLGALIGNLLFPLFMSMGCLPPFLMVGCIMLIASSLSCLLPITHKLALK